MSAMSDEWERIFSEIEESKKEACNCKCAEKGPYSYRGGDPTIDWREEGPSEDIPKCNGGDCNDDGKKREFDTGATRDTVEGKLGYQGFFHPVFMLQFAKYMNMHRYQSDGTLRSASNWQKGIPLDVCIDSLFRHYQDMRLCHQGYPELADSSLIASMMGIIFNVQAYFVQHLLDGGEVVDFDGDNPTGEMRDRLVKHFGVESIKALRELKKSGKVDSE